MCVCVSVCVFIVKPSYRKDYLRHSLYFGPAYGHHSDNCMAVRLSSQHTRKVINYVSSPVDTNIWFRTSPLGHDPYSEIGLIQSWTCQIQWHWSSISSSQMDLPWDAFFLQSRLSWSGISLGPNLSPSSWYKNDGVIMFCEDQHYLPCYECMIGRNLHSFLGHLSSNTVPIQGFL